MEDYVSLVKLPDCFGHYCEISDDCYGCPYQDECEEATIEIEENGYEEWLVIEIYKLTMMEASE